MKNWADKFKDPLVGLVVHAGITYGIVTTQLEWIRSDLNRHERQMARIEDRLMSPQTKVSVPQALLSPALPLPAACSFDTSVAGVLRAEGG